MSILELPNGVKLTLPKGWVVTARYGSQVGYDWNIVLHNKESTMRVCQLATVGKTLPVFSTDGLEVEYVDAYTKRLSGRTSKLKS